MKIISIILFLLKKKGRDFLIKNSKKEGKKSVAKVANLAPKKGKCPKETVSMGTL